MNLPAYPAYQESGVEWLGAIPAHWETGRLKFKAKARTSNVDKLKKEDEVPIRLCNYVDVYHNEVIQEGLSLMEATATEEQIEKFGLKKGDVIITKDSESWNDIAVPAFVPETMEGVVCGYHLSMIRANGDEFSGEYLFRLFCSDVLNDQFKLSANGVTRFGLPKSAIDNAIVVRPPIDEQQLIAAFLDRETARIDALIEKKRKLLELLEEKRLAVITRAVTKGLDPDVPMKDSGIEWLGEVPAHWEVAPISSRYEVTLGKMLDAKKISGNHLAPYLRNVDVQWDQVNTTDLPQMDFDDEDRIRFSLRSGDLLVCEGGEVGRTAEWRGELQECYYQKAIHRVRVCRTGENHRYLYYVLLVSAKLGIFRSGGNPNTIDHLTAVKLKHFRWGFPPVQVQGTIANHLDSACASIDMVKASIGKAIDRLQEYRAALITNAVTGKIDVRKMAEREVA